MSMISCAKERGGGGGGVNYVAWHIPVHYTVHLPIEAWPGHPLQVITGKWSMTV